MLGTIVNSIAIILGSFIGLFLKKGIKEEYRNTIIDGVGLCLLIIGISGGLKSDNIMITIGSIVLGSIIGETIDIEKRLNNLGNNMEMLFGKGDSNFSKGFVTATLVFCIGAMAIVGSIESGLSGNHSTLFAKSLLDGIFSIIFTSTFGIGVIFSTIPVFLYQGSITILASGLVDIMTPELINEISAVGGVLIMAIGVNMLEIKKIKTGNMLPSIFIPIIYFILVNLF